MKYYQSYEDTVVHRLNNRGLNYGDGLFETILINDYTLPFWDYHYKRLHNGLSQLNIKTPPKDLLFSQIKSLIDEKGKFVAKLVVYRDDSKRGYASISRDFCYHIIVNSFTAKSFDDKLSVSGVILSKQPKLAGLKHLNRLEQVIASNELSASQYNDAIMLDNKGNIIETTNKNIILIKNDKIYSPKLNKSGVYGVALAWLEAQGFDINWKKIEFKSLEKYHVMMVCNSINGFQQIKTIDNKIQFKGNSYLVNEIKNKWHSHINPK